MTIVNTVAIILLAVAVVLSRRETQRELDSIHERLLGVLNREIKNCKDDLIFRQNMSDAMDLLEGSYKALQSTTVSALNLFEQQILRGAKEDLEALQELENEPMENKEAEEQPVDSSAGEVRDGENKRSEQGGEDGSYIRRDDHSDGTDISCAE